MDYIFTWGKYTSENLQYIEDNDSDYLDRIIIDSYDKKTNILKTKHPDLCKIIRKKYLLEWENEIVPINKEEKKHIMVQDDSFIEQLKELYDEETFNDPEYKEICIMCNKPNFDEIWRTCEDCRLLYDKPIIKEKKKENKQKQAFWVMGDLCFIYINGDIQQVTKPWKVINGELIID